MADHANREDAHMSSTSPALQMRAVRKTFEAENAPVRALRGVDLEVSRGEFVALTGPSGCGKSTLLNLAAGLEVADEGSIFVAGDEITGQGEDDLARMRRRHIGIVFQFFNLLESVTVLENVALAAIIAGRKRRAAETRARDLLDLLGLGDKASAIPGVLSGGQGQRLAIARALANEPTLVLADEPTGALDSDGGQEVIELLRRLRAGGQTILLVTHDSAVADAADRVASILDGRITADDGVRHEVVGSAVPAQAPLSTRWPPTTRLGPSQDGTSHPVPWRGTVTIAA
jgi:putative ABC transport system ATP-binding protein